MGEDDRTIIRLSEAMYKKYGLRRVYYSAFFPVQETDVLPSESAPIWRRNRLYQADRLIAAYGMTTEELAPEGASFLERDVDPKTAFALRHMEFFPVEVNTAAYEALLRVPGIGLTGASRIMEARRLGRVTPEDFKRMRISLKHSVYFITFNGKYYGKYFGGLDQDSFYLRQRLASSAVRPEQLSLDFICN
jgi:predicted DNA-binding helix-hairpin-helix protein